jgi:hypothetical protein
MSDKYRVWCLSWEDGEEHGRDVVFGPPLTPAPPGCIATAWPGAESAVEAYAEYVHDNRDGHECTWPLTFRVRKPDGTTEDFEVEREYEPTFSASAAR